MALVDYASDSSSSPTDEPPPKKRSRLVAPSSSAPAPAPATAPALPPLPPAFHDLYASTVRTTTSDDPALHQGRTRQIPHIVGNWPSHLYVEWHPSSETQSLLTTLLLALQERAPPDVQISTFLTSDLGAPLPLHISLSRPISLTMADKDAFLSKLVSGICNTRIAPFSLWCRGVEWHHTDESGRSFLVLRVQSHQSNGDVATAPSNIALNPELTGLLRGCNAVVDEHGQPQLYQWAMRYNDSTDSGEDDHLGRAFHVSIAWSFTKPTKELTHLTDEVFCEPKSQARIQQTQIRVDGIKAKIGNIVTHIPLPRVGKRADGGSSKNMFGI